MDDDLMSLRGGSQGNNDDDLFGSFSDPDDLGFDAPAPASRPASADDFDFNDPFNLPSFDEPTITAPAPIAAMPSSTPAPSRASSQPVSQTSKAKPRRKKKSSGTGFLGMTAPQRMVLAIFLFLIVAVYGFLILLVINAINI